MIQGASQAAVGMESRVWRMRSERAVRDDGGAEAKSALRVVSAQLLPPTLAPPTTVVAQMRTLPVVASVCAVIGSIPGCETLIYT